MVNDSGNIKLIGRHLLGDRRWETLRECKKNDKYQLQQQQQQEWSVEEPR